MDARGRSRLAAPQSSCGGQSNGFEPITPGRKEKSQIQFLSHLVCAYFRHGTRDMQHGENVRPPQKEMSKSSKIVVKQTNKCH